MSSDHPHLTITLTGSRPIRIVRAAWPVAASARDAVDVRNGTSLPDYECAEWRLTVRQHADGRAVVYAIASAPGAGWPTHGAADYRGGELLDAGADLVAAIQRVGADLIEHGGAPPSVVRECIAGLSAVAV